MSQKRSYKQYPKEFKEEAVALAENEREELKRLRKENKESKYLRQSRRLVNDDPLHPKRTYQEARD